MVSLPLSVRKESLGVLKPLRHGTAPAGLIQLDTVRRCCRERRLTLRVAAIHHSVLRPLQVTGLDALFDIAPTLEEAIRPRGT
jgi:hypothetical protein